LTSDVFSCNMLLVSSRIDPKGDWFPGPPFPVQTRSAGLVVGLAASAPAVAVTVALFGLLDLGFATAISAASMVAGAVTGATFGRRIAARPTAAGVLFGPALAVVIGGPVGGTTAWLVSYRAYDPLGLTATGLLLYGLPAYVVLALPTFVFGIYLDRSGALQRHTQRPTFARWVG
jgi:hypothetical protein